MEFAIICRDGPDGTRLRQDHLKAHLAYIDTVEGMIKVAGPLADDGGAYRASLLIVDAPDKATARTFVENDPYFRAGVWTSVTVEAYKPVVGAWPGIKAW